MNVFSSNSLDKLNTVCGRLREVCMEAIKITDFAVVCGFRNAEQQEEAFESGKSKVHWNKSKHNSMPSLAVDLAPCVNGKIDWDNRENFVYLAGVMKTCARYLGYDIIWGGDFNNNGNLKDDNFDDYPHFEIKE